jgi:1A family penicillin-binding protein
MILEFDIYRQKLKLLFFQWKQNIRSYLYNLMINWRNRRRHGRIRIQAVSHAKSVKRSRLFVKIAKLGFLGVVLGILALFFVLPLMAFNLPSPDKVVRREGFSSKILDRNGKVLYDIYTDQNRTPVDIKDVPQYLKEATVAVEDKNFYKHQGFDVLGTFRGLSRIFTRGYAQGGSTLTQQLVKNVLLTPERTVWRKIKEFVLAVQIERKYTKDQILQMYLNEAPYGGTTYGVEAAAETYFGKNVKELNLIESAILAGLPQRPSTYSPYSATPEAYIDRTKQVLRRMNEDGYITKEQEDSALSDLEGIKFQEKGANFKAPHFVQYIQKLLEDRYGEQVLEQGGLKVTTTLDLDLQEKAQQIVTDEIKKVQSYDISNGAAVVVDSQTGEILAMVGSRGFNDPDIDGQVNVALALRQPGSSFKPFTYVTAFKKGYTPSTLLMDVPTEFEAGPGQPPYKPVNYEGTFQGPVQVRYALANSINIPAVKMMAMVGIEDTLKTANDMGITTLAPDKETLARVGLSLTLGGGEVRLLDMAEAYGAFMNTGYKLEPTAILKVEDSKGKVLEEVKPQKGRRVLTPEQAYLITDILSDNEARKAVFGLNSLLYIQGRDVAVKTGTTNEKRDNWTVGGTPQAVVGVWVGNNDNSPMKQVASGITGASPIWRGILLAYLEGKPKVSFETPGGIVTKAVDTVSGYAAHDGFPSRIEKFIVGTEPTGEDPVHVKLKVCKSDGRIATPADIASGNYEEKEFIILKESDPLANPGDPNKWQEGVDAWIATQSDSRYHPPTEFCGTGNPLNVDFGTPHDRDSNLPSKFNVEIRPDSTNDITDVELYVDDGKIRTFTGPPYTHELNLSDGVHQIRALAKDSGGHEADRTITVGVNVAWDYKPPTPTPVPTSTPTPTLTPIPTVTPSI